MQCSVKKNLLSNNQQQTEQSAKVDTMGYRSEDTMDLFLQRELGMEVQMAELSTRMHTLKAAAQDDRPKPDTPTISSSKVGTVSLYLTANGGVLSGNPGASSTRKRDQLVGDLSSQATK